MRVQRPLSAREYGVDRPTAALFAIEHPREDDTRFLQVGLKVFPGEDWVRVGTAAVDFRLGRHDTAMVTLDAVSRRGGRPVIMTTEITLEPHAVIDVHARDAQVIARIPGAVARRVIGSDDAIWVAPRASWLALSAIND